MTSAGDRTFTGHSDGIIRARDFYTLIILETYRDHVDLVSSLRFDDSNILYSASFDGSIKRWNMASRKVAFSFENRNGSVSSLAIIDKQLYVGLKSGTIVMYDVETALETQTFNFHNRATTALLAVNGSIYSSSNDGSIVKISIPDKNPVEVYNSKPEQLRGLAMNSLHLIAIRDDTKVVLILDRNVHSSLNRIIDSQTPLVAVAATESEILAGSRSGIIYSWSVETLNLLFELKGHLSQVNYLLIVDNSLFSASNDKTVIEWSLKDQITAKVYKRLSASALGHLGSVNALSHCFGTIFSAGSDLTTRRWNINTGRHEDVYFGFSKPVTSVLCFNRSVFAGSEDFAVLMYKPNLPALQINAVSTETPGVSNPTRRQARKVKVTRSATASTSASQSLLVIVAIALATVLSIGVSIMLYRHLVKRAQFSSPATRSDFESGLTVTDLGTVINSIMGISKHAAYLIENSSVAKIKKIASGGGGELSLVKVMDPVLRKKTGDTLVQKVVFAKSKIHEEAFYQEVGIMIMLNPFPNFCQIVGYTENPLSIILTYYPDGSMYDWIRKNTYRSKIMVKLLKEVAGALNVIHSHFLAHCDIKTQNILIQVKEGLPCCFLTDFGIAQILSEKIIATKSFHIVNLRGLSVHYAAPEALANFRSKKFNADYKTYDIYSYAIVMYETMTRTSAWSNTN
jgi:WD40 repeat protein/tRNA A-37 threonylcarbamoyl transferase component Bud32